MITELIKFETLDQILNDSKCYELTLTEIYSIRNKRAEILSKAKWGAKIKRGPFDTLDDCAMLTHVGLVTEYKLIQSKESKLAAREREFIDLIVSKAIIGTIRFYEAKEKAQKLRAEAKKKREAKQSEKI